MKRQALYYMVGIFDSSIDDEWPHFFAEEGLFLSSKQRQCSWKSAFKSENKEEAVELFHRWKTKNKTRGSFKLKLVRCLEWIEDPSLTAYPEGHPMNEVDSSDLRSNYRATAFMYFADIDTSYPSLKTRKKHRDLLLDRFGFDIDSPLLDSLKLHPVRTTIDDPFKEGPDLIVVTG